jgi:hypothetical protein
MPNEIAEPANQDNQAAFPEAQPAEASISTTLEASEAIPETNATEPQEPQEPAEGDINDQSLSGMFPVTGEDIVTRGMHLSSLDVNEAVAGVLNPPPKRHPVVDLQEILFGYKISLAVDQASDTTIGLVASKLMPNGDTHYTACSLKVDAPAQDYADFASRAVNDLLGKGK